MLGLNKRVFPESSLLFFELSWSRFSFNFSNLAKIRKVPIKVGRNTDKIIRGEHRNIKDIQVCNCIGLKLFLTYLKSVSLCYIHCSSKSKTRGYNLSLRNAKYFLAFHTTEDELNQWHFSGNMTFSHEQITREIVFLGYHPT